jgi:hypothetical protein
MKYFLTLVILSNMLFSNNLVSNDNNKDKKSLNDKVFDKNKEIPKYKKSIFSDIDLEFSGSITIGHEF